MENEGIKSMSFLFMVPLLFIIGCIGLDFVLIYKQKSELNKDLNYIIDLYKENNITRILSYSDENDFKTSYYKVEGNKMEFVVTKEVKFKTPVPKVVYGELYKIEIKKVIDIE